MIRNRIKKLRDRVEHKVREQLEKTIAQRASDDAASSAHDDAATPAGARADQSLKRQTSRADLEQAAADPPVVARLMVEIRSDGSRTIARGALQDELNGERVSLEAHGNSPLELAAKLTKALVTAPLIAGQLFSGGSRIRGKRSDSRPTLDRDKPGDDD